MAGVVNAVTSLFRREKANSHREEVRSSGQDPLNPSVLPYEAATHILGFVPPLELVRACKLVCRGWRDFLAEPGLWRHLMNKGGNHSAKLNSVSGVNWPKLCYHTLCQPNMIKSFDNDGKLSFASWKTSSTEWRIFKLSSQGARVDGGGGNGWAVEQWINSEENTDLLGENSGCVSNYVTSYGWCCREQVIKLIDIGLSNDIMDEISPRIEVSEWFCARWDCGSRFFIRVELLDARKELLKFFEHSVMTEQWSGGELGWRKIQHVFDAYSPGVRYLRFVDAGKDTQFWAGHFGSKMAAAWVRVRFS